MAAELEGLMEEVAKLKAKDNQIKGFLHTFVHINTFFKTYQAPSFGEFCEKKTI